MFADVHRLQRQLYRNRSLAPNVPPKVAKREPKHPALVPKLPAERQLREDLRGMFNRYRAWCANTEETT